jgi:hypothetical protein
MQQQRFHEFVKEFDQERPHEALGYEVPAQVYKNSCRHYPNRLPWGSAPSMNAIRRYIPPTSNSACWIPTKCNSEPPGTSGAQVGEPPPELSP